MPDVALDADPTTGMLIGETQTFPDGVYYDEYRIGGTSLASPLFAGHDRAGARSTPAVGSGFAQPDDLQRQAGGAFTDVAGLAGRRGRRPRRLRQRHDASDGLLYTVRHVQPGLAASPIDSRLGRRDRSR